MKYLVFMDATTGEGKEKKKVIQSMWVSDFNAVEKKMESSDFITYIPESKWLAQTRR